MKNATRRWRPVIATLSLLLLLTLSGCATAKNYYFQDSDKLYIGKAGETVKPEFDYVLMSQGKYRQITTFPADK